MGQTRNLQTVLDHCSAIYPSLFVTQHVQLENEVIDFKSYYNNENIRNEHDKCIDLKHREVESQLHETVQKAVNLNLDGVNSQNDEKGRPSTTPLTEREVKDVLEVVLTEAVRYLSQGDNNTKVNDCCELGKACTSCRNEISHIVESIVTKVMESPRFKASPRCSSSRIYSNEPLNKVGENVTLKCTQEKILADVPKASSDDFDYSLLKDGLLKGNSDDRISILRDLRRDLTRNGKSEASRILKDYVRHDIFDIKGKCLLPEEILQSNSARVNVQFFHLVNTVASFRRGRQYLASNDDFLKSVLVPKMKQELNPLSRDMLVASLQKISLQKHTRSEMVREGVLGYLVGFLDDLYEKMSPYSLENCIALLMNLCVEDEAKYYCTHNSQKVVNLLKKLLRYPHTSYVPYINATLLGLLSNEEINLEARRQSLDKVIQKFAQGLGNENLQRQLSYIVQVRFGEQLRRFIGDDGEFSEDDVLESELDSDADQEVVSEAQGRCRRPDLNSAEKAAQSNGIRKKKILPRTQVFPKTSFCYLEICPEVHDGSRTCRCFDCVPGKSRYSCGCYDSIRREIAEEINGVDKGRSVNRNKLLKETFEDRDASESSLQICKGARCDICGDKVCECAFESRPKIHRTPPKP